MKQSISLYINQPIVLTLKLCYPFSKSAKEQLEYERIMSQYQLPESEGKYIKAIEMEKKKDP